MTSFVVHLTSALDPCCFGVAIACSRFSMSVATLPDSCCRHLGAEMAT